MKIAVLGVSGHGRAVGQMLMASGHQVVYLDDEPKGAIVEGGSSLLQDETFLEKHRVVIGLGSNKLRHHFSLGVIKSGGHLREVKDKMSSVDSSALVGIGCQFFAMSVVGNHCRIGNFCIINNGAVVPHDCVLSDAVQIADNATLGGGVRIGTRTLIGIGATVLPRVRIGADVTIGAGSVVTRDIGDREVWVGNPARLLRSEK